MLMTLCHELALIDLDRIGHLLSLAVPFSLCAPVTRRMWWNM